MERFASNKNLISFASVLSYKKGFALVREPGTHVIQSSAIVVIENKT